MTTAQDAISTLAAHVGIPLGMRDGSCELLVGDQPFSIRHDEARDRLVVSALVADDLPAAPSRQLVCDLLSLGFGMMEDGLPRARPRDGVPRRVRDLPARHALPGGVPRRLRQVRVVRDGPCRPPRRGARRYVGPAGRRAPRRRRVPGLQPRPHLRLGRQAGRSKI